MFAGKKSAQIREILISESAWEEMTCLFAPSLAIDFKEVTKTSFVSKLKAHPGKVHIAIVVGTRNVGHLKSHWAITHGGQWQ